MESESNKPLPGQRAWAWANPPDYPRTDPCDILKLRLRFHSQSRLLLMPMSKQPPLPLDELGGPDVLGVFPGSMAEFRSACASGCPVVPLLPDCPEGVQIVGRLLAFYWQAGVLVGSATAIDRWLTLRGDREPIPGPSET